MLNGKWQQKWQKIINCSKGVVKQATKNLQLVLQHRCKSELNSMAMLRVLPPTKQKAFQPYLLEDKFKRWW